MIVGAFNLASNTMLTVGHPTLAVSPMNGTKSDLRRPGIKNFPGGTCLHVPHPLARALRALYAISHVSHWNPLFKVLDPPLLWKRESLSCN